MKLCMIGKRGHAYYVFESIREVPGIELPCVSSGCCDDPEPLLKMARQRIPARIPRGLESHAR